MNDQDYELGDEIIPLPRPGMTTSHTPGPWSVIFNNNPSEDEIIASDGDHVASTWSLSLRDLEERYANALLIAAAPELLALCQRFRQMYGSLWDVVDPEGCGHLSPESVEKYDEIHEAMYAAIARATGSQP